MVIGLPHIAAFLLAVATLAAGPAQSAKSTGPVISVSEDSGGEIVNYLLRTALAREQHAEVHIDGRCDSACTLFLSLPPRQLCLGARAYFRFHLPIADDPQTVHEAAGILTRKYPAWVNDWIASNNGLSENLLTMDFAQAHMHIKACGTEQGAGKMPQRNSNSRQRG